MMNMTMIHVMVIKNEGNGDKQQKHHKELYTIALKVHENDNLLAVPVVHVGDVVKIQLVKEVVQGIYFYFTFSLF